MPDKYGFDHLVQRGTIELRCIWCGHTASPATRETLLRRHARRHSRDAVLAAEAAKKEMAVLRASPAQAARQGFTYRKETLK